MISFIIIYVINKQICETLILLHLSINLRFEDDTIMLSMKLRCAEGTVMLAEDKKGFQNLRNTGK